MKSDSNNWKKVKIEISYLNEDENKPVHIDTIQFKDKGLESLKEIDSNPTKAIVLALQVALKLKRSNLSSQERSPNQNEKVTNQVEIPSNENNNLEEIT
jgi:hypothetical protein